MTTDKDFDRKRREFDRFWKREQRIEIAMIVLALVGQGIFLLLSVLLIAAAATAGVLIVLSVFGIPIPWVSQ